MWSVIAVKPRQEDEELKLLHLVLYHDKPTNDDMDCLEEELQTDQQLGMVGVEYELMILDESFTEELAKQLNVDLADFPKTLN